MFAKHYARCYDWLNRSKPYRKEANFVCRWAGKPNWIFDIGCGTARHWQYYPEDVRIFGIEKARSMIPPEKEHAIIDLRASFFIYRKNENEK